MPAPMKQNGVLFQLDIIEPRTVCQTARKMASNGTSNSAAATALSVGIQTGTGAPGGMPHQVAKRMNVQNPNNAR